MAQKILPGTFEARVSDYGIGTVKDGAPQVMVLFAYRDQDGDEHEITWFGSLKEGKAQEITLKALLTCGFTGSDPSDLADGVHSGLMDTMSPVMIVIEENEYQGKKSMRVQWVNPIGGKTMEKRIEKSQAKVLMGALNLKGQLAMLREQQGQKKPAQTMTKKAAGHPFEPGSDIDTGDFGL